MPKYGHVVECWRDNTLKNVWAWRCWCANMEMSDVDAMIRWRMCGVERCWWANVVWRSDTLMYCMCGRKEVLMRKCAEVVECRSDDTLVDGLTCRDVDAQMWKCCRVLTRSTMMCQTVDVLVHVLVRKRGDVVWERCWLWVCDVELGSASWVECAVVVLCTISVCECQYCVFASCVVWNGFVVVLLFWWHALRLCLSRFLCVVQNWKLQQVPIQPARVVLSRNIIHTQTHRHTHAQQSTILFIQFTAEVITSSSGFISSSSLPVWSFAENSFISLSFCFWEHKKVWKKQKKKKKQKRQRITKNLSNLRFCREIRFSIGDVDGYLFRSL